MRLVTLVLLLIGLLIVSESCVVATVPPEGKKKTERPLRNIKVMIIDTGISPIAEIKPFLSTVNDEQDLRDNHGHGTHITGLVLYGPHLDDKVCPEVEIYSCKFFKPAIHTTTNCFKAAKNMGIDIVNFSGGGQEEIPEENEAVKDYPGIVVTAVGNYQQDDKGKIIKPAWNIAKEPYFPASLNLPNVKVIGNGTSEKNRAISSNYGLPGMIWRNGENLWSFDKDFGKRVMSGSSQATAVYTHELLKAKCQRLRSVK